MPNEVARDILPDIVLCLIYALSVLIYLASFCFQRRFSPERIDRVALKRRPARFAHVLLRIMPDLMRYGEQVCRTPSLIDAAPCRVNIEHDLTCLRVVVSVVVSKVGIPHVEAKLTRQCIHRHTNFLRDGSGKFVLK